MMSNAYTHFDERQAERIVAKSLAGMFSRLNSSGAKGAEARFNVALFRPFLMAVVAENNRGSSAADIEQAIAAAISNMMVTWSTTLADSDDPDAVIPHFNRMAVLVDDFTTLGLQQGAQDPGTKIHAQQAGHG